MPYQYRGNAPLGQGFLGGLNSGLQLYDRRQYNKRQRTLDQRDDQNYQLHLQDRNRRIRHEDKAEARGDQEYQLKLRNDKEDREREAVEFTDDQYAARVNTDILDMRRSLADRDVNNQSMLDFANFIESQDFVVEDGIEPEDAVTPDVMDGINRSFSSFIGEGKKIIDFENLEATSGHPALMAILEVDQEGGSKDIKPMTNNRGSYDGGDEIMELPFEVFFGARQSMSRVLAREAEKNPRLKKLLGGKVPDMNTREGRNRMVEAIRTFAGGKTAKKSKAAQRTKIQDENRKEIRELRKVFFKHRLEMKEIKARGETKKGVEAKVSFVRENIANFDGNQMTFDQAFKYAQTSIIDPDKFTLQYATDAYERFKLMKAEDDPDRPIESFLVEAKEMLAALSKLNGTDQPRPDLQRSNDREGEKSRNIVQMEQPFDADAFLDNALGSPEQEPGQILELNDSQGGQEFDSVAAGLNLPDPLEEDGRLIKINKTGQLLRAMNGGWIEVNQ